MKLILCTLLLTVNPLAIAATIYKHVDANGTVTYTNIPIHGAKAIQLSHTPTKTSLPKTSLGATVLVDGHIQRQRDESRRKILQQELSNEEKALQHAKLILEREGSADTLPEQAQRLRAAVTDREKNIVAIQSELSRISTSAQK